MIYNIILITKRDQTVINIINLMDSTISNTLIILYKITYNIIFFANSESLL